LVPDRVEPLPVPLIISTSSFERRRPSLKFLSNLLLTYAMPLFFPLLSFKGVILWIRRALNVSSSLSSVLVSKAITVERKEEARDETAKTSNAHLQRFLRFALACLCNEVTYVFEREYLWVLIPISDQIINKHRPGYIIPLFWLARTIRYKT